MSNQTILRKLKTLEKVFSVKKEPIDIIMWMGEPHGGKYGYAHITFNEAWEAKFKPCTPNEEMAVLHDTYENMNVDYKKRVSFEEFLRAREIDV